MEEEIEFDWEMPEGSWTDNRGYHKDFANVLIKIQNRLDFKISARGWCYQLEQFEVITKNQFDKIQGKINECVKKGLLPMDFVAEDVAHEWLGVEIPTNKSHKEYLKESFEEDIENNFWYTPDWWKDEDYYIQMVVEKVDLVTLFKPICDKFHIPITKFLFSFLFISKLRKSYLKT